MLRIEFGHAAAGLEAGCKHDSEETLTRGWDSPRAGNSERRTLCKHSEVYGAMDMDWAKLVGQIAQTYGK